MHEEIEISKWSNDTKMKLLNNMEESNSEIGLNFHIIESDNW